jgi:hypothetical protein
MSVSSLLAAFVFGSIGLFLFQVGRKRQNLQVMITGIVMMGYSYFTTSPALDWGIGLGLSAAAYYFWNN